MDRFIFWGQAFIKTRNGKKTSTPINSLSFALSEKQYWKNKNKVSRWWKPLYIKAGWVLVSWVMADTTRTPTLATNYRLYTYFFPTQKSHLWFPHFLQHFTLALLNQVSPFHWKKIRFNQDWIFFAGFLHIYILIQKMAVAMASSCSNFGLYSNLRAMEKQSNLKAASFLCSFGSDRLQLSCINSKKRYFICNLDSIFMNLCSWVVFSSRCWNMIILYGTVELDLRTS